MRAIVTALAPTCLAGCSPLLWLFVSTGPTEVGTISLGQVVASTTADDEDRAELGCGEPGGASDEAWLFVPPESGAYVVRVDAAYDSAIAVREGDGDGDELACNDDYGDQSTSQLVVVLAAVESYAIVVDGFRAARGSYRLRVTRADAAVRAAAGPPSREDVAATERRCAAAPLLPDGASRGVLEPNPATARVSCGAGGPGGEVIYRVDVTASSILQVRAVSDLDAILELRRGCSEGHRVVACVDDAPDVRHTALTTHLEPGTYYLFLDSHDAGARGPYGLDVSLIADAASQDEPHED